MALVKVFKVKVKVKCWKKAIYTSCIGSYKQIAFKLGKYVEDLNGGCDTVKYDVPGQGQWVIAQGQILSITKFYI